MDAGTVKKIAALLNEAQLDVDMGRLDLTKSPLLTAVQLMFQEWPSISKIVTRLEAVEQRAAELEKKLAAHTRVHF